MYLATFLPPDSEIPQVGCILPPEDRGRAAGFLPGLGEGRVLNLCASAKKLGISIPRSLREILKEKRLGEVRRTVAALRKELKASPRRFRRFVFEEHSVRFLPPIPDPPKIILVGKNYREHCAEGKAEVPDSPVIFAKFSTALVGCGDPIVLPRLSHEVDYEAELAVVMGRRGKHIPRKDAFAHIAGYTALNDVSARDFQFKDGQWVRAKSCDTFCPCGPALATKDVVRDPQKLRIRCFLNGSVMQDAATAQMIFPVSELVAFISKVITLEPGDIIATGTPSGVGCFRSPPVFLKNGDIVRVEIEKVGVLTNPVREEAGRKARARRRRPGKVFD